MDRNPGERGLRMLAIPEDVGRDGAYDLFMAEKFSSGALPPTKRERYDALRLEIGAVLDGERNRVARMATAAAMLAATFDTFLWTGFYVVDPERRDELVVGPYQGTLGCLRIRFGQGVCGAAAATVRTLIVDNVDDFPGHITCDSRSRSEIVVPVLDPGGRLIAVLDVDSAQAAAFDAVDQAGLEAIVHEVFAGESSRQGRVSTRSILRWRPRR